MKYLSCKHNIFTACSFIKPEVQEGTISTTYSYIYLFFFSTSLWIEIQLLSFISVWGDIFSTLVSKGIVQSTIMQTSCGFKYFVCTLYRIQEHDLFILFPCFEYVSQDLSILCTRFSISFAFLLNCAHNLVKRAHKLEKKLKMTRPLRGSVDMTLKGWKSLFHWLLLV